MSTGDVQAAVQHFDYAQQSVFQEIFTITQADMAQMAADMQPIELIYQQNNTAEYRINRDIVFKGNPETVAFYIYFQRGADGIWRIWDF